MAEKGWSFDDTMKERGAVTGRLNAKNYKCWQTMALMSLMRHILCQIRLLKSGCDDRQELTARLLSHRCRSNVLPIPGLTTTKHVYTNWYSNPKLSCQNKSRVS